MKFSTQSNEDKLHFGTILCSMGVRYKTYCSSLVRTMMVVPTQQQQELYSFLLNVYESVLEQLTPGNTFSNVYNAAIKLIEV